MNQLPEYLRNRASRRSVADNVYQGLGVAAPPYVSIKGGAFTLVDSNGEQAPVETNYLDCIIIDAAATPSRVYWGKDRPFDPGADSYQAPECFSDNGVGASRNALNPQSVSCQTCPQNVWGSATSKVSGKPVKACGVVKKLAVLAYTSGEKDAEGIYAGNLAAEFPFLLRVPVMSHDNLRGFSDQFKGQPFDVSDVVTRVTFEHGAVGVLDFKALAFVNPKTNTNINKILAGKVTDQLVGRNDQPIEALPAKAAAEPVEQPKPTPKARTAEPLQIAPAVTAKSGRGRPRKTAAAAEETTSPFAPQQPRTAPFAVQQPLAQHGIVTNAGAPPGDVEKALDSLFNLKT